MDKLILEYNNQTYRCDIAPYFDGVGVSLSINNANGYQVVSIPPIISPSDGWVIIDNLKYPDIEDVLIHHNVIKNKKAKLVNVGLHDYHCYQLTEEAYELYESKKKSLLTIWWKVSLPH